MEHSIAVTPSLSLTLDRVVATPDDAPATGRADAVRRRLVTDLLGMVIIFTLLAAYLVVRL